MPFLFNKLCNHQLIFINSRISNKNLRLIHTSSCKFRKSLYDILGIKINASASEIKKAYFEKSKIHHPDRNVTGTKAEKKKNEKQFINIQKAYEILGDANSKDEYDKKTFGRVSSNIERRTPKKDIQETQTTFYNIKRKPLKRSKEERMFELVERREDRGIFVSRQSHEFYENLKKRQQDVQREEASAPIMMLVVIAVIILIFLL